jgi:uncharacterized spore protein YtfJ
MTAKSAQGDAMAVQEILKTLLGELKSIARSETVVGDPIRAGDTTIVPVSRVNIGFGVGGGDMDGELPTSRPSKGHAGVAGTGGGISVDPVAFIVVNPEGRAQLLPLRGSISQVARVIDLVPEVLDRLMKGRSNGENEGESGDQDTDDSA